MRLTVWVLWATAAAVSGCGSGGDATGCPALSGGALEAWAEAGFSGTIAVASAEEVDCVESFGLADRERSIANSADTVFSIGSVSKAFTAAAVLALVDDGALTLDDRAGQLLPTLSGRVADASIQQLLLHTSGLTGSHGSDHRPLTRAQAIDAIGGLELAFEPGTEFLYSNAGYTLLALIVEEVSGVAYRDFLVSRILPLPNERSAGGFWDGDPAAPGPRAVGYLDDGPTDEMGGFDGPHWALSGNGDLAMTIPELALWTYALFTGQVVSDEAVEIVAEPRFDHDDGTGEAPGWVTFDESRFGEPFLATAGGGGDIGHEAVVVWIPAEQRAIAIASNTPAVTAEELVQAIGPALVTGEPLPRPRAGGDIDPEAAQAATGTYGLPGGSSLTVAYVDGELIVTAEGPDAIAVLFPLPDDVTANEVESHEGDVAALLAGETEQGREEVELLESDFGPIDQVVIDATIVADGELRTYVTAHSGERSMLLWYALDDKGGIAAVEGPTPPPTRSIVPSDDGTYRPDDPSGSEVGLTIEFAESLMTITSPSGVAVAARAD